MKPEVTIRVRFGTTAEDGRKQAVIIKDQPLYRCVLRIGDHAFDCRILLQNKTLQLGESYELPIKFVSPDLALPNLRPGLSISLWEGKNIASGEVVTVQSISTRS